MASPRLSDLRGVRQPAARPSRCQTCGDTGLVAIEGATPARGWREIPREFLPCVCISGDKARRMFVDEGWL